MKLTTTTTKETVLKVLDPKQWFLLKWVKKYVGENTKTSKKVRPGELEFERTQHTAKRVVLLRVHVGCER